MEASTCIRGQERTRYGDCVRMTVPSNCAVSDLELDVPFAPMLTLVLMYLVPASPSLEETSGEIQSCGLKINSTWIMNCCEELGVPHCSMCEE